MCFGQSYKNIVPNISYGYDYYKLNNLEFSTKDLYKLKDNNDKYIELRIKDITRFKLENEDIENIDSYELLKMIGKKRGMLVSGGEIDTERAAIMLLDEFRSAKLGRITVEMPQGR